MTSKVTPIAPLEKVYWEDISDVMEGDFEMVEPGVLFREDGLGMLYEGALNAFIGETESGKTMAALVACDAHMEAGGVVFYLDFEMDKPSIAGRLNLFGVSSKLVSTQFRYANWPEDVDARVAQIARTAEKGHSVLVVVDSVDELLLSLGVDPNSQESGSRLSELFGKTLKPVGVTTLLIDHVSTSREGQRKRGAAGSFRKLANVDAAFKFQTKQQPRPGHVGWVELRINKDRYGTLRARSPISPSTANKEQVFGTIYFDSTADPNHIEVRIAGSHVSEAPIAGQDACIKLLYRKGAFEQSSGVSQRGVQDILQKEADDLGRGENFSQWAAKNGLKKARDNGMTATSDNSHWLTSKGKGHAELKFGEGMPV